MTTYDPYAGTFVETRAILAAQAQDDEVVRDIVKGMYDGELSALLDAALTLIAEVHEEQKRRRRGA